MLQSGSSCQPPEGKPMAAMAAIFMQNSVEMEVVLNGCWVLEIQNAATTNQIGRFGGLDVILDKVSCTSAIFKQVCYCSRFALPLQRSLVLHPK